MAPIPKEQFIDPFRETLGTEKADALFDETIAALGITPAEAYPAQESNRILDYLQAKGGLLAIVASNIRIRLILGGDLKKE